MTTCKECGGKGYCDADYPSSNHYRCPECGGSGEVGEEGVDFWVCTRCEQTFEEELDDGICEWCREELEEEMEEQRQKIREFCKRERRKAIIKNTLEVIGGVIFCLLLYILTVLIFCL